MRARFAAGELGGVILVIGRSYRVYGNSINCLRLMVGLRGVGKTVLLDRMREDAEGSGIHTVRIEAPSLPGFRSS